MFFTANELNCARAPSREFVCDMKVCCLTSIARMFYSWLPVASAACRYTIWPAYRCYANPAPCLSPRRLIAEHSCSSKGGGFIGLVFKVIRCQRDTFFWGAIRLRSNHIAERFSQDEKKRKNDGDSVISVDVEKPHRHTNVQGRPF